MSARDYALVQLDSATLPNWKPRTLRRRVGAPVDPRDIALAEQLRVGVIKNLLWLQYLIAHHSARPLGKIDPTLQKILALALYQVRFLSRVPQHAAVDEAVNQAHRFGRTSAAGFVNAVLRNAIRNADPSDAPLYVQWSHPPELLDRFTRIQPDPRQMDAFCRHNNSTPPTIVRLCRGTDVSQLAAEGVTIQKHLTHEDAFIVSPARPSILADWARRGVAQVQDPTAAAAVKMMSLGPGMTVLDRCCGAGTKTLQIREAVGVDGNVFAIDPNGARANLLRHALAERAISNVGVIEASWLADAADALPRQFDRALVDAPCSNSGVLSRRAEARYRQDDASIRSLEQLQAKLLDDTAAVVKPGGMMIYSTCSIWPQENQAVAEAFVAHRGDFRITEQRLTLPGSAAGPADYHDGGYLAVLEKLAS